MPRAQLIRRVRFAAAHRYRRPDWTEQRNTEVFGMCARPNFHGHTYTCFVTIEGSVDPETGMITDLGLLDRVLKEQVMVRFDHRNINLDVPEFAEGLLVPTGENLALFIMERVQAALGSNVRVRRVQVDEDETLSAAVTNDG